MPSKLQAEIQQTKGFRSLEEEVMLNLERTVDTLSRSFEALLKPFGLTPTQYNVLRILRGAGKAGLMCSQTAERMITRDPDITRLLDRLEKRGLIRRARDPRDRRVVLTSITPAGLKLLEPLDDAVDHLHRRQLGHLSPVKLRTLRTLLEEARSPS
jgi:DNA-binding MarR family transcriptional regulator